MKIHQKLQPPLPQGDAFLRLHLGMTIQNYHSHAKIKEAKGEDTQDLLILVVDSLELWLHRNLHSPKKDTKQPRTSQQCDGPAEIQT